MYGQSEFNGLDASVAFPRILKGFSLAVAKMALLTIVAVALFSLFR